MCNSVSIPARDDPDISNDFAIFFTSFKFIFGEKHPVLYLHTYHKLVFCSSYWYSTKELNICVFHQHILPDIRYPTEGRKSKRPDYPASIPNTCNHNLVTLNVPGDTEDFVEYNYIHIYIYNYIYIIYSIIAWCTFGIINQNCNVKTATSTANIFCSRVQQLTVWQS